MYLKTSGRSRFQIRPDHTRLPLVPRWTQVQGWSRKFSAGIQLSILGTATVALFLISLVGDPVRTGVGEDGAVLSYRLFACRYLTPMWNPGPTGVSGLGLIACSVLWSTYSWPTLTAFSVE